MKDSQYVELCKSLRTKILNFKSEHPRLSSQQVAKLFDMSNSTLNRIENIEIKRPSVEQVLKILCGVGSKSDIQKYLDKFYPELSDVYFEHHQVNSLSNTEKIDIDPELDKELIEELSYLEASKILRQQELSDDFVPFIEGNFPEIYKRHKSIYPNEADQKYVPIKIEKYFQDPRTFKIVTAIFSGLNLSRISIKQRFGKSGISALNELIINGVLVEGPDGVLAGKNDLYCMSQDVLKKMSLLAIEQCYDPDNISEGQDFLSFQSEAVDRELVMPEIVKILTKTQLDIRSIFRDRKFKGEDCIFVGLVSDSLI